MRSVALVPYGIVAVVAAYSWNLRLVARNGGWIPQLLGLTSDPLSHTFGSYVAIIITEIWKNTPFMALLLLAGLALVPDELLEAAKVDGASTWQRFYPDHAAADEAGDPRRAAVPHAGRVPDLRRRSTSSIKGAQGTESISMLNYSTLLDRLNLGLGSAVSVLFFLLVALIAWSCSSGAFGAAAAPGGGPRR